MTDITLATATKMRDAYIAADLAVSTGQSYSMGGVALTRANAAEITKKINYWSSQVARLSRTGGGMRTRLAVPIDG